MTERTEPKKKRSRKLQPMTQTTMTELDEGLYVRIDLKHHQTQSWQLNTCMRRQHDAAQELLRIARKFQRIEQELKERTDGPMQDVDAVRLRIGITTVAETNRSVWPAKSKTVYRADSEKGKTSPKAKTPRSAKTATAEPS